MEHSFWIVNYTSCEGNRRWHVVRTPADWDLYMVEQRAREGCGGCGDDPAEILSVEAHYPDDIYTD